MSEEEIAQVVIEYLQELGWEIYQEIQFGNVLGRVADIVAVRDDEVWVIEVKRSFGIAVLEQAWLWEVPMRSVAVLKTKQRPRTWLKLAKDFYKVGILEVDWKNNKAVREVMPPPILTFHWKSAIEKVKKLTELHKTFAKAGTNKGNHLTSYKMTMLKVKEFVSENEGCTVKEIVDDLGYMHYANVQSAKQNILSGLNDFEDWCRIDSTISPARLYLT